MSDLEFALKLIKVKIEEINFKEPDEDFINNFDENFLKISVGLKFSHNLEKEVLTVNLNILYDYQKDDDDIKTSLLDYKGSFDFHIQNLKNLVKIENDSINFPNVILETVAGISISSGRGIIIAKTAGSFVNKFYLPILDTRELLKNDNENNIVE
ncbi:hypothetical protein [Flavobacterium xanthum]|uniref:Uncharacterized protein n=1 Tax=Flavobacterium xanthum TaxID=69322 RepID=A0A1M7LR36_9FLAO|nr:hypothetical protein [Flavobacterium xanthum]SHM80721.1 hypothetical protein SAMN05443669_10823 [Flavobacterium xanthum]